MGARDPVLFTIIETPVPTHRSRRPRLHLTKRWGPASTDVQSYDKASHFMFRMRAVRAADEMFEMLAELAQDPHAAIIRGQPRPGLDLARPQRRLLHRRGDDEPTVSRGQAIDWAAFDLDKSAPATGIDWRTHPGAAAAAIAERDLPAWVNAADRVAYYSSSQGIKPEMKLRVVVLLEEPRTSGELKAILKPLVASGECPIDLALYSDVQPHYTATPLFTGAAVDPLPGGRHYLLRGERVRALAPPPPPPTLKQLRARTTGHGMSTGAAAMQFRPSVYRDARSALAAIEREIASMGEEEEGKAGFHRPAIRALAHLFHAFGPDADPIPIIARWRRAVLTRGRRDASYIDREQRGLFRFAEDLHAREQPRRMATIAALERAAHTHSLLRRRIAS